MKIHKFLSSVAFITLFSLLYVYQQTEIFRLAYLGQKRQIVLQDSLEKNTMLRYNIGKNSSLVYIGNRVSASNDFQMPDSYRLVRLAPASEGLSLKEERISQETILSRIFGIKRQAEAGPVSP